MLSILLELVSFSLSTTRILGSILYCRMTKARDGWWTERKGERDKKVPFLLLLLFFSYTFYSFSHDYIFLLLLPSFVLGVYHQKNQLLYHLETNLPYRHFCYGIWSSSYVSRYCTSTQYCTARYSRAGISVELNFVNFMWRLLKVLPVVTQIISYS